jgi:uncharacterized protein DUF1207
MPLPLPRAAIAAVVLLFGLVRSASFAAASMAQSADPQDPPAIEQLTIPDLTPPHDSDANDEDADVPMAELWTCHWLPNGLIYRSYLAGVKEPRFALVQSRVDDLGRIWDASLGGRVAILRYGTSSASRPEGYEIDLEGGAMPRLQPAEKSSPLDSCDYRIGLPLTYGCGPWQYKSGYTHLSSHLGDEFMIRHPDVDRINYVRDSWMFGVGYFYTDDVRLFAEYDYAFVLGGGSQPCELQYGLEYSPAAPGGAPFAAAYVNQRQELNFGGYFVVQGGWQIRSAEADHTLRLGMEFVNGANTQYEFYNTFEQRLGLGVWYDY